MSVAEDAASWLYNKVKPEANPMTTLADSESATSDPNTMQIQLMAQQASRAKFDKWLKRAGFALAGAAAAYWFLALRKRG